MWINLNLNGSHDRCEIHPGELLSELLSRLNLISSDHPLVLVDGCLVDSSLMLAAQVNARKVETDPINPIKQEYPALTEKDLELEALA